MSDLERNLAPPETDAELYATLRDEIHLRIGQQNRCIDQSILITTGLIAAIAAVLASDKFAQLSRSHNARILIVLGFFLYTLVHEMLCMNYVYQTWLILGIARYVRAPKVALRDRSPGSWERDASGMLYDGLGRVGLLIAGFQPSLIYASIIIGIVLFFSSIISANLTGAVWFVCWALLALSILLLLILVTVHRRVVREASRLAPV